ncbi:CHAT domain-containing protein [Vannielia litorea]|uniref:CHAT domain-containing protein n=1 Tax=Vannielia litorea TaxID=1217970 RepID=A0A1N6FDA8_9RHOB|nr:CHAT domain-containing protein [Vannielia litorea]SIN93271.1 CHAT domain-containing protein [Vannielia litorea]
MLRLTHLFLTLACLALPARAEEVPFDYPHMPGAAQEFYETARAGEPTAAYNYVLPLFSETGLTDAERRQMTGWLRAAYNGYDHGDATGVLYAAMAAKLLTTLYSELAEHSFALGWANLCIEALGERWEEQEANLTLGQCLEAAAVALNELSRYGEAIEHAGLARQVYKVFAEDDPLRDFYVANTLMLEANALDGLKRHREAIGVSEDALEIFERMEGAESASVAAITANIGASYWYLKELEPARDWSLRALPLLDRHWGPHSYAPAVVRVNLGLIAFDMGEDEKAMRYAVEILPYIATNPRSSLNNQRWTFELMRNIFARRGQVEKAILFGKMAVNAQQEIRALNQSLPEEDTEGLRAEWSRLYRDLADLMIAEGRFSEAQAVLNMEKEQEAFEFLRRDGEAELRDTVAVLTDSEKSDAEKLAELALRPVEARAAWETLSARLAAGGGTAEEEDQLFLLEDAMAEANAAFEAEVEEFLTAVSFDRRAGFAALFDATGAYQSILEARERPSAILQLAMLDDATHLFLTLPGATVHEQVAVPREEMNRMVFDALQAIEARSPEAQARLHALHEVLFAPIRPALETAGTEVVMVNADGVLRYVPFAALHDGSRYLVEDFAFALYVAAVQTQFSRPPRASESAAGFGVTEAHEGFSALPGVASELETLFTAADGEGVLAGQALLDGAFDTRALRRALRDPPELLHIASHFALRPGRDDDSFLLLGDGTRLPLSELRSSKFRFTGVDLLTLSACQTARGGDGSEIDGFGAAALMGGASAVLASLWPVADAATPILMRDFYAGLYQRGEDKAEALRRAQIAMLHGAGAGEAPGESANRAATALKAGPSAGAVSDFAHPYFWSAFVLMGNWL